MRNFPIKIALNTFGVTAVDTEGLSSLQQIWDDCYSGRPDWLGVSDKYFKVPRILCYEVSALAVSEAVISANNDTAQDICNRNILPNLQPAIQLALAHGNCVLRPWVDEMRKTHVDIYRASEFIPTACSDSKVISGIFVDYKIERDANNTVIRTWTKLEYQDYNPSTRTVTVSVRAFQKKGEISAVDLGYPTSLESVPEWAAITPDFSLQDIDGPLFAFVKTPWLPECTVNTAFGASIFADALDQIRDVNERLNDTDWEFSSAQRRMVVDDSAIPVDENGNQYYGKGEARLYRKLTGSASADNSIKDLYGDYSPAIRVDAYNADVKKLMSMTSIACHMDCGYLQFDRQTGQITATEVISQNHRSFATVCNVQSKIAEPAVRHLLASFASILTAYGVNSFTEEDIANVAIAWNDGIMNDPQAEHDNAIAEHASGLMSTEWFLTHIRGLSKEEAIEEMARIKAETPVVQTPSYNIGG